MVTVAKMTEFRRYSQKLMAAPEPPSAMASSGLCSPRTRLKAPRLKSAGSRLLAFEAREALLDSAVRSIQRNGAIVTTTAMATRVQAPTRRQLTGFLGAGAEVAGLLREGAEVVMAGVP